jgi:Ca2+-binding EF-hand superfamily protein
MSLSAAQIEKAVDEVFAKYDKDHNGYLDRNEIYSMLDESHKRMGKEPKNTMEEVKKFIGESDKNSDGRI